MLQPKDVVFQIAFKILNVFFLLPCLKLSQLWKRCSNEVIFSKRLQAIFMTHARPVLDIPIFHKMYDLYKLIRIIAQTRQQFPLEILTQASWKKNAIQAFPLGER